ncbi:hypothetical protein [Mucilaginibacter sp. CSA2-8R]|uniref:hypothetical protein n=1 Tax=Mucilaginibacter sp. CSA2-8R TaxID=3141542 RepID=UPI00315C95D5
MKPIRLSDINESIFDIDLFICAISFEQRCFSLLKNIDVQRLSNIWFTYNVNESEFFNDNIVTAQQYHSASFVEFSTDDPLITGKSLLAKFESIAHVRNLVVDVSTFTHEGLLILFRFITLFKHKFDNVHMAYVGAKAYSINEKNDNEKWLSKGTKSIRSILGYPGILNPSQKNHLIILFGFESERTSKLIENFEFDKVSIGIGPIDDSIDSNHYQINRQRHIDLLEIYPFAETFEFSLTNPFDTKEQVSAQITRYKDHNTVITPLNNKLSSIGAALVAIEDPRVQLCYVRAHEYNYKGYSEPSDYCYIIKIF